jgi:hypothetical protein
MRKLETLQAWQTGKALCRAAYGLTLHPPLSRHFGLADQIRRAAVWTPHSRRRRSPIRKWRCSWDWSGR